MNTINIAIALNKAVLYPAYVMLRSLAKNHTTCQLHVYVLYHELNEENCNFLKDALLRGMDNNQIFFISIDAKRTSDLPYNPPWSVEIYYRLMLPELLGDQIDRILYLDVDIIINKDITEFYFTDFEDKLMIVSKDMEFEQTLSTDTPESKPRHEFFRELSKDGMTYFCSGVLLMNLSKLKEFYSFDKYKEIFVQFMIKQAFRIKIY